MKHPFLDFKIISLSDTQKLIGQCTGNADKGIFISYPTNDEPMIDFLAKILSAVKLDLHSDVLILRKTPNNDFSFSSFSQEINIQKVILFGIHPQAIGLQINYQKYHPIKLNDCLFVFADELTAISANQQLKKLLWNALKEVFSASNR